MRSKFITDFVSKEVDLLQGVSQNRDIFALYF